MTIARAVALTGLIALSACQPPPPKPVYNVEHGRSYQRPRDAVWSNVLQFLETKGFTLTSADPAAGVIQAGRKGFEDMGWADCELAWVTDQDGKRPSRARHGTRDVALQVEVSDAADATAVALAATFVENQINPYRNLPFKAPCRSTGVLEAALLNAI